MGKVHDEPGRRKRPHHPSSTAPAPTWEEYGTRLLVEPDPLRLLTGCARMCLVHWFLPGVDGNLFDPPYLPGSPLATAVAPTVTSVSLSFEPCLRKIRRSRALPVST